MSILLLDYDYLISKKILTEYLPHFKHLKNGKGLAIVIQTELYNKLQSLEIKNRQPVLESDEFKKQIIDFIPFSYDKNKKIIILYCNHTLTKYIKSLLQVLYENFPHNYNIVLNLDFTNEKFSQNCKAIAPYFSFPLLDAVNKIVTFYRDNDLDHQFDSKDTLHLIEKILEDYEQMINKDVAVLKCNILVKFDQKSIEELRKLNSKVFERKHKFSGLEMSDKFQIKDISETKNNDTLITLTMNEGELKLGDNDSVDVVFSKYTYHTHPKKTYESFEVKLAWPSQSDFESFIILFKNNITIFHIVCTEEGIYASTINPNFIPYLQELDEDDLIKICEENFDIRYPHKNEKKNKIKLILI
jgi:hypothetical protein